MKKFLHLFLFIFSIRHDVYLRLSIGVDRIHIKSCIIKVTGQRLNFLKVTKNVITKLRKYIKIIDFFCLEFQNYLEGVNI